MSEWLAAGRSLSRIGQPDRERQRALERALEKQTITEPPRRLVCPLLEAGSEGRDLKKKSEDGSSSGFGVPDWLLGPLVVAAIALLRRASQVGLERTVPPRFLPWMGGPQKVGSKQQKMILKELGQHALFTQAVFELFNLSHAPCVRTYEKLSLEQVLDDLERRDDEPDHLVCLLLASGRGSDAQAVAVWAKQQVLVQAFDPPSQGNLIGTSDSDLDVSGLHRALEEERRSRKRAEHALIGAERSEEAHSKRAVDAEQQAVDAYRKVATAAEEAIELSEQIAKLKTELRKTARERRTLLLERERLLGRFLRARRDLRMIRAKVPDQVPISAGCLFEVSTSRPPPSVGELNERYRSGGSRSVLEAKPLILMIDGWNVVLGHMLTGNLRDRRLRLERTLAGYEARTGNRVLVVYDGREDVSITMPQARGILRVFTLEDESADDYIVSELEIGTGLLAPVVATSDRELGRRCRDFGAFVVTSDELARFLKL